MRLEEGTNLAHGDGNSLLGFLPRDTAHLGVWCEHRALHGDGIWVRGTSPGRTKIRTPALSKCAWALRVAHLRTQPTGCASTAAVIRVGARFRRLQMKGPP